MPFNSLAFLALLLASWCAVQAFRRPAYVLITASLVFYAVAGPFDTIVFLVTVSLNWLIQLSGLRARWKITLAVLLNIGLIVGFKYKSLLLGAAGATGSYTDTGLPLGISFYCFQALAYHIDVARRQTAPASSFASFFLFKSFFPQLVAGPIVRAHQFLPQIERLFTGSRRRPRLIAFGLALCALGLVKKVVFADSLAPLVDEIFMAPPESAYLAWLGAALFTFQIYFDFSGYSDIAIGAAYLLGLRLPVNFLTPYISLGPREFWQRWHISLSTWIRDYLYIPLGGRHGTWIRSAIVLVASMALAGLWHGANITFIIWGTAWGIYILLGRLWPCRLEVFAPLRWLVHMLIVVALWVLFRSPSFDFAMDYFRAMLSVSNWSIPEHGAPAGYVCTGIAGLFVLHWLEARAAGRPAVLILRRYDGPLLWGCLISISLILVLIPTAAVNPFIYFRF
ncbi:MBOAT family O-acyltransferase [Ferrovibrio sp.]|uniref:MBOAT family O-acyltransferase n=1 Tax=Ferrovibrio sp. TaxID=1917215 RepID=UPI000CCAD438|nr:MBOAT family O-acyltransferase [Ferrovibrio sp.]PJI41991.1 MAG: membrane-bound O-acyltransferase family protein [Ferrovibrio sp.]